MPLMANLQPTGFGEHYPSAVPLELDQDHNIRSRQEREQEREERDSGYEVFDSFDEEREKSDMEGSILHRPRPKKAPKAPVLPARSNKRASKIFENILLELKNLDGSAPEDKAEQLSIISSDPHELYLSSEEDASFSDDYENSLLDFEASPTEDGEDSKPASRASSRQSQEDTARVVSFTSVGKPQIIDIFVPHNIPAVRKRYSIALDTFTTSSPKSTRRPTPLKLYPSSVRRISISSTSSNILTHPNYSVSSLPPRQSSRLSSLITSSRNALSHSFLASDPFSTKETRRDSDNGSEMQREEDVEHTPITPKTPTSMSAALWKRNLSRTMSKVRKPSMQTLSLAYTGSVIDNPVSKDSLVSQPDPACTQSPVPKDEDEKSMIKRAVTMPLTPITPCGGPILYKDVLRNAIKAPPPPSPVKERKMSLGTKMGMSIGLNRRKSIKGRADRYLG